MDENSSDRLSGPYDALAIRRGCLKFLAVAIAAGLLLTWQFWFGHIWVASQSYRDRANNRPFDSAAWKVDLRATTNVRLNMLADLLKRHELIGLTAKEVVDLLGEPTGTKTTAENAAEWHYILAQREAQ